MGEDTTCPPASPEDDAVRSELLGLLAGSNGEKPTTPQATELANFVAEDLEIGNYRVKTRIDGTQPAFVLTAHNRKQSSLLPVLFLLHATGSSNHAMLQSGLMGRFARRGFFVVAMDARHHGQRLNATLETPPTVEPYYAALVDAYEHNSKSEDKRYPFLLDNLWDLSRVLDWLQTDVALQERVGFDPVRVGATGVSLGGMHAWLWAVADRRLQAIAPLIGVQSFGASIDDRTYKARVESVRPLFQRVRADTGSLEPSEVEDVWRVMFPGLVRRFDAPVTLPLLARAGVAVLAINGELDPRCPIGPVRTAVKLAGPPVELHVEIGVAHAATPAMLDLAATFLLDKLSEHDRVKGATQQHDRVKAALASAGNLLGDW